MAPGMWSATRNSSRNEAASWKFGKRSCARRAICDNSRLNPDHLVDRVIAMPTTEPAAKLIQPNAQNQYTVTAADLPLSCPMPGMHLWNSHPRVYLPIEKTGWAKCPYC